jgi:hypothetical protein
MKSCTFKALVLMVFFFPLSFTTNTALAICDQGDAPDCACFDDTGDWDAGGLSATGIIQEVALDTLGTRESCATNIDGDDLEKDTGKPYYSIVLGCNSRSCALTAAYVLAYGAEGVLERRQAWCSETIAYWHREAGIPYRYGYGGDDGSLGWLIKSVPAMKSWYESEEDGGRGRWVDAEEIDYNDFQLGVNAPVPGAYMAITGCVKNVNNDYFAYYDAAGHSLMVDTMTIHRDGTGRIFQVEATFLEGNSGNRVRNSRHWDDIIVFTPQGSQWVYWAAGDDGIEGTIDDVGVKIYGFGIDLDENGEPIYDQDRLQYKDHMFIRAAAFDPWDIEDNAWDNEYAARIPAMKVLSAKLRKNQGPDITCSSDKIQCSKLPNGNDSTWYFPMGVVEEIGILVDYLAPNPQPLEGVRLFWAPDYLPGNFKVLLGEGNMGEKGYEEHYTTLTDYSNFKPMPNSGPIPMMARLERPVTGIRYVKLVFPKGTFAKQSALLRDLILPRHEEKWRDADDVGEDLPVFVDIKPGTCPNILRPGEGGNILVALLGSKTMLVNKIDPETIKFNGKEVKLLGKHYKDVAMPFIGSAPGCQTLGLDDYPDLVLSYDKEEFRKALDLETLGDGQYLPVRVTGKLDVKYGGMPLLGQDFVKAPGKYLPFLPLLTDE